MMARPKLNAAFWKWFGNSVVRNEGDEGGVPRDRLGHVKQSMQRSLWLCSLAPMAEQKKHRRRAAWMNYLDSLAGGRA